MIEKWLDNFNNISNGRKAGKCPFCNGVNVDYKCTVVVPESRLGFMDIWCNDCRKAFHVSRMQVSEDMKTDGEIPKDLKY